MEYLLSCSMDRRLVKKISRHILGWFFIVLGVLGCFLPILQGILFLLVGTIILAPEVPFFQRQLNKFRYRYPHIFHKARLILRYFKRVVRKRIL